MNDNESKALLPAGLGDMLPPEAALEARLIETLMARFAAHGYERVKPPLIEFEESLLAGAGAAMAPQTFRVMDPISQRMMGVRADITLQVARIAASRLADMPRPLRLSYAGQVLRVKGTQLRPERQFAQVGTELIGVDSAHADAEAVLLAAAALRGIGVDGLSADLSLPTLVTVLCQALELAPPIVGKLREALERKDETAVARCFDAKTKTHADLFRALLRAAGPAEKAVAALRAAPMPGPARAEADRLAEAVALIAKSKPGLKLTADPVEYRGWEYQSGVSFTLFAMGVRGELGRGGRYTTVGNGNAEPATGFTLYMDTVLEAVAPGSQPPRLYAPVEIGWQALDAWRAKNFVIVCGLEKVADVKKEARRLNCSHVLIGGQAVALEAGK